MDKTLEVRAPFLIGIVDVIAVPSLTLFSFYLDLTAELRLHPPRYPQREFWRALEHADNADVVRAVTAIRVHIRTKFHR
jgi:hypothetical protein